jgi:hypothetical protein
VVKYGLPIGHALADIAPGEHIHSHNTRTNLSDLDEYSYQPDFQAESGRRRIATYRSTAVATVTWGSATNWILPPWAALTASRVRSRRVF